MPRPVRCRSLTIAAALLLALALPAARAAGGSGSIERYRAERERQRLLAGHLLRRLGFGPNRREMHELRRIGTTAYIEQQLNPGSIDDRLGERRFHPAPRPDGEGMEWQTRWLTRMAYSRQQLQEKMALLWHEHFATSAGKVGSFALMRDQEELFRNYGLGSFRDLVVLVTIDNAMLIYLDNAYNDGQAFDGEGNRIPPNENYARELLQLFALGVYQLNMDGTLALDDFGRPVPAYTEDDVKEVARALTGWQPDYPDDTDPEDPTEFIEQAAFADYAHDPGEKRFLGEVVAAGGGGVAEVEQVVDIIMAQPSTAPFISKQLIQKLATETPTPGYVERVATVFQRSGGDLRETVRAILTDGEFWSADVIRSQYRTPIEHIVGAVRGLDARSGGNTLYFWTSQCGHLVYYPPTVFSFYRPGQKRSLVNAAYVATRDAASDMIVEGYVDRFFDTAWDPAGMIRRHRLRYRPGRAVDLLARDLLAAPASEGVRQTLIDYIGPEVTEEKLRGAAWLLLASPDYQVN